MRPSEYPSYCDTETYTLDGVHNRISNTNGATPGNYNLGPAGSTTHRLNQYATSPLSQFTHDPRGNMRSESAHCRGDIAPLQPNGDIGDHQVNVSDLTRFLGQFGQPVVQGPPPPVGSGNAECDLNGDGLINVGDLTALLGNFGAGCDWTEYRYDWADRLVEVKASSWANGQGSGTGPARVEVHTSQYDALGRRIAKTLFANGSVGAGLPPARCTHFIHGGVGSAGDAAVGWQVLEEQDGTGRTLATFVPSGRYVDETVCFQRDLAGSGLLENHAISSSPEPVCGPPVSAAAAVLQEFWLHADDQFSTTSVTDSNGAVVERYDYHDYGFPLILDPDGVPAGVNAQGMYASKVGNPRLFTGREWDAESKLYHYRTRAYHPGLGRFLQIDRIGVWGDGLGLGNGSAFNGSNPTSLLDPLGLAPKCKPIGPRSRVPGLVPGYDYNPDENENDDLLTPEEKQRGDDFYRDIGDYLDRRYHESGFDIAVDVGVIILFTVTPLDEVGAAAWAAERGFVLLRGAAGEIIGMMRMGKAAEKAATRFINGVKVVDKDGKILEGTVDLKPTLDRIKDGIPHPHPRDGTEFKNLVPKGADKPSLPAQPPGHYKEYVVPTPGMPAGRAGEQRIVRGADGKMFYTPDHYKSFVPIN